VAGWNEWRFSTKRKDTVATGVLYEQRGYNSSTGSWNSRDPIGETGGENVYGLLSNDAINYQDLYGLDVIQSIKDVEWENSSRVSVEAARTAVSAVKYPMLPILKLVLEGQLIGPGGHAKDAIAVMLFKNYLYGNVDPWELTLGDMQSMNSGALGPRIDIRKAGWDAKEVSEVWKSTLAAAKASICTEVPYSVVVPWVWDNGAIANYLVHASGSIKCTSTDSSKCRWRGTLKFTDRFDLNPNWGYPSGHRSAGGERRTRIGYILSIGNDFDITSVDATARQGANDSWVTINGVLPTLLKPWPAGGDL
jgi:RHS repeat-associated protein